MQLSPRQIMNRIYQDICGFEIPKGDEIAVKKSKGSPTYGEITIGSTDRLFRALDLTKRDVFYDLGSGVGKVILYAGLFTSVRQAVGIELSKMRHQDSVMALARAAQFEGNLPNRCEFLNDDLLNVDLSSASVIYTCSTAFSVAFMRKLTAHLGKFTHDFKLVTLQDLPNERHFTMMDKLKLDMSWQRNTPVYIYRRC